MVDRRLVGIIIMAFAVSSALFSLVIGERVSEPIEILKHEWNLPITPEGAYRVPTKEGRYAYGLGLVARKPMSQLEIFFITLENETRMLGDADISDEISLRDVLLSVPEAGKALSLVGDYADREGIRILEEAFGTGVDDEIAEGYLMDITEPFIGTAPIPVTRSLRSVHAVLRSKGGVLQYFRGHRDFFIDRNSTVIDLSIQHNQNLTKYAQRTTEQGTSASMDLAPQEGYIGLGNLKKEDQVFVSFAVNPSMVRTRETMLHIVLIYIDGSLHKSLVTTLVRPLTV